MKKITGFLLKNGLLAWTLLLSVWMAASSVISADILPGPLTVFKGGIELARNGTLFRYVLVSYTRIFTGWVFGVIIAVPLGLLIGQFALFRYCLDPIINFFRFVPAIGFLSLFMIWFGVGEESKVALIVYATIFPITINTIAGARSVTPVSLQVARSLGASPAQIFFTITVPSAVPHIFTGARLGLSGALISIVAAEMLAAKEGIGYLIYTSRMYFRSEWIFVGIIILGLSGYLFDRLIRFVGYATLGRFGVKG